MSAKSVLLYRIRIIITATIIAFICGAVMAFFTILGALLSAVLFLTLAVVFFLYPALLYKSYSVTIANEILCVTKGVILLRHYYTHISNICYISKITTPLQHFFGVFSICLYTRSGKIYISNLETIPDVFKEFIDE